MDIKIGKENIDGKTEVIIRYFEEIGEFGQSGTISVWVDSIDSRSKLYSLAEEEAKEFLKRALSAH